MIIGLDHHAGPQRLNGDGAIFRLNPGACHEAGLGLIDLNQGGVTVTTVVFGSVVEIDGLIIAIGLYRECAVRVQGDLLACGQDHGISGCYSNVIDMGDGECAAR